MASVSSYLTCGNVEYNQYSFSQNVGKNENNARILEALRAEKEEVEAALSKERLESLRLKQELADADTRKTDLTKAHFSCYFTLLNNSNKIHGIFMNIIQVVHHYTYECIIV